MPSRLSMKLMLPLMLPRAMSMKLMLPPRSHPQPPPRQSQIPPPRKSATPPELSNSRPAAEPSLSVDVPSGPRRLLSRRADVQAVAARLRRTARQSTRQPREIMNREGVEPRRPKTFALGPGAVPTTSLYTWARNHVHNKSLHRGPKPCRQTSVAHVPETMPHKSLQTWARDPAQTQHKTSLHTWAPDRIHNK